MAPFSSAMENAMLDARVQARGLGGIGSHADVELTASQGYTLQIIAVTFSVFSVASSVLAFYWFVKMRRSFRHDLVMLLIQSDMFKALWFMIYPIVTFTRGPVPSDSGFCQINGFFLALGIEASDFAVLMIALHTALYIFKPKVAGGEGGLYPYRKIAYVCWGIFPVLMASLAFVNPTSAYVSSGAYCYLPVRPFWFRLALSWIPRYIIFLVILCIYVSIYYYVRYKFQGFKRNEVESPINSNSLDSETARQPPKGSNLPPTPALVCHGLIPEAEPPQSIEEALEAPKFLIPTMSPSMERRGSTTAEAHRFIWANIMASNIPARAPVPPVRSSPSETDSFAGPQTPQPLPDLSSATPVFPQSVHSSLTSPSRTRITSWQDNFVHRYSLHEANSEHTQRSSADMFSVLRHPDGSDSIPISQIELVNSRGQNLANIEMIRTRDKIRRQLRFLFIYPLVYIGMWVIPFVSHGLQYEDKYATNPPFGLTCVSTAFICTGAAVDSWLFSTREKPWRHIPGSDGTFWGSLKFWSGWSSVGKRRPFSGPGKTRDEMVREARVAYRRREDEEAERRMATTTMPREDTTRRGRDWWENIGDGAMSTVAEEPTIVEFTISEDSADEDTLTNVKTRDSRTTEGEQHHPTTSTHKAST